MKHQLSYLFLIALLVGCASNEVVKFQDVPNRYDPNQPREITAIHPSEGGIGELFVLEGNFGDSLSQMKVYFDGDREAVLISTDGQSIYGIVPKQPGGKNSISVVVEDETITSEKVTFDYTVYERVSTVSGTFKERKSVDGNIYQATYGVITALCVVSNDNIIVTEYWDGGHVRLVSTQESEVTTLVSGIAPAQPVANKAGDVMYVINADGYTLYKFEQSNGWMPTLLRTNIGLGEIFKAKLYDLAMDDSEEWLYTKDIAGNFGRISLTETDENGDLKAELLFSITPSTNTSEYAFISWSSIDKCFFATSSREYGIYKIYEDANGNWQQEQYAGFNRVGHFDGEKLSEAQFNQPFGITIGDDGSVYVIELGNHVVRKIDRITGYVTTVAGVVGGSTTEEINGAPLESTFFAPHSMRVDSEGNFYIAGGDGCTLRKLAIE